MNRDVSQLSRKERLKIIKRESPELISIVNELKDMMAELQRKINPVRSLIQEVMLLTRAFKNLPSLTCLAPVYIYIYVCMYV